MPFMQMFRRSAVALLAVSCLGVTAARANPAVVVDAATGEVLYKDLATAPWFPASTTKLMTTYVALSRVREGKLTLDTPLRVSAYAASMAPSKMGFRPGTLVTLDNALKMLMVKSPNDIAVTIAEGVSGSVPAFADDMNAYARKIGLHESHFVNPNGLPDPGHVSSARDMAMIARALIRDFPEEGDLFNIGALQFGNRIIPNHNGLLGRYPGVDGMKTGYTCSAGYNVVETATRGDRRLIVVIMGAPSTNERNLKAVSLFERYFASAGEGLGDIAALPTSDIVEAPDLRGQICGPGRHNAIEEAEAADAAIGLAPGSAATVATPLFGHAPERADVLAMAAAPAVPLAGPAALLHPRDPFVPVRVFIGAAPGSRVVPVGSIEAAAPGPAARTAAVAPETLDGGVEPGSAGRPLALAGAVAVPAALAATNRAVTAKGRLSMRAPARPAAAKPGAAKAAKRAPAPKAAIVAKKAAVKAAIVAKKVAPKPAAAKSAVKAGRKKVASH